MKCIYCRSSNIRFSRLRLTDLSRIVRLKLPVRCRNCNERVFVGMLAACELALTPKSRHKRRHRDKNGSRTSRNSAAA